MANEPDDKARGENIDVIRQLLQKLEEVAAKDDAPPSGPPGLTPPGLAKSSTAKGNLGTTEHSTVGLGNSDITRLRPSGTDPLAEPRSDPFQLIDQDDGPKRELASLRRPGMLQRIPTDNVPALRSDTSLAPPSMSVTLNHDVDDSDEAEPPGRRGSNAALIGTASFILGAVCAGALVYILDPLKQRTIGQQPVSSVATTTAVVSTATKGPPAAAASTAVPSAGEPATPSAPVPTVTEAPAESPSPPSNPPAASTTAAAPSTSPVARAGATAAPTSAIIYALSVPSRLEARVGRPAVYPLRIEPAPDEAASLLVVMRGVPSWLTMSNGSSLGNDLWVIPAHLTADLTVEPDGTAAEAADVKVELATIEGRILARSATMIRVSREPDTPTVPVATPTDPQSRPVQEQAQRLLANAELLLDTGELAAARTMFANAAAAGNAAAALRLAETYDPAHVQRLGVAAAASEPALARDWYERAAALGSSTAGERLAAMTPR